MNDLEDSFKAEYAENDEEMNKRILAAQQRIAELQPLQAQQPTQNTSQQPPQQEQQPANTDANHSVGEHLGEVVPALASGAMKAASNVAESLDELWDWGGEHWDALTELHAQFKDVPLSNESSYQLPKLQMDTNTGKIVETGAQFLTTFIPMVRGLKMVGMGATAAGMAAGAGADYAAFAPNAGRLADAVQSLAPELKIPVVSYLTTDENDSTFEARMKNVVDGALGGAAAGALGDVFMRSIKALKGAVPKEVIEETLRTQEKVGAKTLEESGAEHNVRAENDRLLMQPDEEPHLFTTTPDNIAKEIAGKLTKGEDFTKLADEFNFDYIENGEQLRNAINSVNEHLPDLLEKQGFKDTHTWEDIMSDNRAYFKQNGLEISKDLLKTNEAIKDFDSHLTVIRGMHSAVSEKLTQAVDEIIASGGGTPAQTLRLNRLVAMTADIGAMAKGATTSAGRALNSMKIVSNGKLVPDELIEMAAHAKGGPGSALDLAKRLKAIEDPAIKTKFIDKVSGAKGLGMVQYWWLNSLLSSPTTWIVNGTSNAGVVADSVLTSAAAATRNALGGKGAVTYGVVGDQMAGMWYGLTSAIKISAEAGRAAGRFLINGDRAALKQTLNDTENVGSAWQSLFKKTSSLDPTQTTKFDYDLDPVNSGNMSGFIGKATKLIHAAVGIPGNVLMATDELFKTIHYQGAMHMQASIGGRKLGLKGDELTQYMANRLANPLTEDTKFAIQTAKVGTFQNDLGKAGKAVQTIVQNVPLTRFVMPFVRTPTNIIKYAAHHSPFMAYPGFRKLSAQMTADIEAGGVRRELAEAKVATGSLLFAVAGLAAANGILTGGVDEEYSNGSAALIGKQQYSIKLGDKQYSFSRLDPFGMFFGVTADMHELVTKMDEREWSETAGGLLLSLSNNLTNKTYLKGLVDFTDAFMNTHGSDKKAEKWFTNFTTSFIPNFMNQTNKIHMDEQLKEVTSYMDAVKSRVYGLSKEVAPKRDPITGEPQTVNEGLLGGYLPIQNQKVKDDPLLNELHRIGFSPKGLPDTLISNSREGKADIKLDGKEKDRLHVLYTQEAKINGKNLQEFLRDLIDSPGYQRLPDNGPEQYGTNTRTKQVNDTITRFRNVGKKMLTQESQSVSSKISDRLMAIANEAQQNLQ